MKFLLHIIILIIFSACTSPALCAEIDSITPRGITLEDSLKPLNAEINKRLQIGVENANSWHLSFSNAAGESYCNEEILYKELRKSIFGALTASWGLKGYSLDKQLRALLADRSYSLPLNDSIYRDISYIEGISLNVKELSDIVNIDGNLIGLDKIGHFFAEGWKYFELTNEKEQTLQQAIHWGRDQEEGAFGYTTTGIFSYADLVANFNGWRFWNRVLPGRDDPLKSKLANLFTTSYTGCSLQILDSIRSKKLIRAWTVKKKFNLMDYLDGAWDEGNNCVSFKDPIIEEKVMSRVKNIAPEFNCPASENKCRAAVKRYGSYAKYILHPACLTVENTGQNK
jgi:hypothetical protein